MIDTAHVIKFDPENCVGCKLCYKACFVDVIRWDETRGLSSNTLKTANTAIARPCAKELHRVIPDYSSEKLLQTFDRYL